MESLTGIAFGTNPDGTFTKPYFGPRDHSSLEGYYLDWESKVTAYLLLSTHYNDLYRLAVIGNAAYEKSGDTDAYTPLMEVLRALHESGGESGARMVANFIKQLRVYDAQGVACADVLKGLYYDPHSDDAFLKDLSVGWQYWIFGATSQNVKIGSNGYDTLIGETGNNKLWGRGGNDRLEGGTGSDAYLFGRGDGHDVIYENETIYSSTTRRNIVSLGAGIGTDDIEFLFRRTGASLYDFVIRIKDTGDTLTVQQGLSSTKSNSTNANSIQAIEFADGTVWNWADILARSFHVADDSLDGQGYASYEGSCPP